jgi:eukaryotic-like serine/threonine-protein kinase
MTNSWTELYTLFGELADLDQASREARLREIGARDRALRDQLEAMLAADASAETRLDEYARAAARSVLAAPDPRRAGDPLGIAGATIGHYRIDGLLGAGGMGVVYRATDLRLERPVALKFLSPGWSMDAHAKRRFLHEARTASSLDHPNICTIYEADQTEDGKLYIAMTCYEGATLRERLRHGPLDIGTALDLAAQTARGLAAAHARGLVHRDIKPGNLLVTTDGTVKILDFGVVKAADLGLTTPDQRPGTAAYMAPEQARGETVDGRADLWSLGVVLYQMLTGARPEVDGDGGVDRQSGAGDPARPDGEARSAGEGTGAPPPSALRAGVSEPVDALVLRLIEDSPEARPQRAEDVAAELERLASGGGEPGGAGSVSSAGAAGPTFGSSAGAHAQALA